MHATAYIVWMNTYLSIPFQLLSFYKVESCMQFVGAHIQRPTKLQMYGVGFGLKNHTTYELLTSQTASMPGFYALSRRVVWR